MTVAPTNVRAAATHKPPWFNMKPSVSIEATADGLRWKVVIDGETVASGAAKSMEDAKAAADEYVARMSEEPIVGP